MEVATTIPRLIALLACALSAPLHAAWQRELTRFSLLAAVGIAVVFTFIANSVNAEHRRTSNVISEYPLAQPNAIVIVPVTIGTDKYNFMLATGATRSSIDLSLRSLLGKRLKEERTSTLIGRERVAAYEAPSMAIGDMPLPNLECIWCADQTMDSRISGERIDGELGMDALQGFIIQIDCDQARLRFLSSASDADGTAVKLHRIAGAPFIVAHFGNAGQQLVHLTAGSGGPSAGMLENRTFSRLLAERELEIASAGYISNSSNPKETRDGRISTIRIGDHTIKDAIIARGRSSALSLGFFSRFVVTLDFPNDVMYLRPGKQFARVDVPDRSGLHVLRIDQETVVHSVDRGSPSEVCGLRAEDRILAIGAIPISQLTMYEVRRQFRVAEGHLALVVRRGPHEIVNLSFDAKHRGADNIPAGNRSSRQ